MVEASNNNKFDMPLDTKKQILMKLLSISEEAVDVRLAQLSSACDHDLGIIRFWDGGDEQESYAHWEDIKNSLRTPVLPRIVSIEAMNKAMAEVTESLMKIHDVLVESEPMLEKFLELEKRIERKVLAVINLDKQWGAKSAFEVWYPKDVSDRIRRLTETVAVFKLLKSKFETFQANLSRLLTLHTDAPTGEFYRYGNARHVVDDEPTMPVGGHQTIKESPHFGI
jgi:hypothetical protein